MSAPAHTPVHLTRAGVSLVLGRDDSLYSDVASILVYPSTMITPPRRPGTFEQPRAPISDGHAILGEAMLGGPVILAWDTVLAGAREDIAGNVVFHELAHKIDMASGSICLAFGCMNFRVTGKVFGLLL